MKSKLLVLFVLFSASFYGQSAMLSSIKHTESDFVIPKDLKVVYRGIENELVIEVPNSKSFEVSGNGIQKRDKNLYTLNPGAGLETTITIDIVLKNNKRIKENHVFKIRNIPNAVSSINHKKGLVKFSKNQLKNAVVNVTIPDRNIDFGIVVTGFTVRLPGGKIIEVSGNKINSSISDTNLSRYDELTIYDIRFTKKIRGLLCSIPPIIVEIL